MNIEARIQEQRTHEAIKKNYMGQEGKIYLIAKYIGHEITQDSNEGGEVLDFDDLDLNQSNEIPYLSDDNYSFAVGYSYNGLDSGTHLEITALDYESTIKVYYKGYLVYFEEGSVLLKFIPDERWESLIESLYERVSNKMEAVVEKYKKEEKEYLEKMEKEEIAKLRANWGDIV